MPMQELSPSQRSYRLTAGDALPPVAAPRQSTLTPVDYDPWAQPIPPLPPGYTLDRPPAKPGMFDDLIPTPPPGFSIDRLAPKLVPVDHDPWAQSADAPSRPQVSFDDLIPAPQAAPQALTPGGVPIGANGLPRVDISTAPGRTEQLPPPTPRGPPSALHSLAVGTQGVGSGLKDIALAPVDLMAGLQNAIAATINKVTGTSIPMATPASKLFEHVTEPFTIPESEMSPGEKLGYNVNRFGTQALGTGAMLATRAPAIAAQTLPSPTVGGRVLDSLARPYKDAPARTLTGDAIGGAGAGVAVNAVDDYVPDNAVVGGAAPKQIANVLAPLAGGLGANTLQSAAEGVAGLFRNIATRSFSSAPHEIPLNPATRQPFTVPDVERAATKMQSSATGAPAALAQDIRENAAALTNPTKPGETPLDASALPTSGLLSQDPGLVTLEAGSRMRNSPPFITRDQNVKQAAAERVDNMRDPEADLGSVFRRASQVRDEKLAPAQQREAQFESLNDRVSQARQREGGEFGAVANSGAKAQASGRLDRNIVDESYVPARAEKNRQYNEAPGRNDQLPADEVFAAIDRVRAGANGLAPGTLPTDFMRRLDALRPRMVEEPPGSGTMVNQGGPGTASGADLADLRKFTGAARERAQQSGNFDLADNLSRLQTALNGTIERAPGYAEANANYGQFADRFRPDRNDEMAKFTREIDRGGNTDGIPNRGATPPSETAGRFLSSPEKTLALRRVLEGAPNLQAGQAAVRDYMRSDFASSALNADGTLNPARASAWTRNNADVLATMPVLQREFDGIVQSARRGQQLSGEARSGLDQARAARRTSEAEVDRSAVGTLLKEDPRDVASKLLGGSYSAGRKADEIAALVKNDAQAQRGWKAAVAEVLADKVQGTRQVGETPEVQFARLAKEFRDNEPLLAKTFSHEEMNNLRQAHTILGYFKEAEKRATVGSDTADKWNIPGLIQLGARHIYGDLKGGGIIKRFKLLLEQLPSNKQSADEIVYMAWFNPDVAAYLLERPIKNTNVASHNINLRRLMAADNAARESGPD